MQAAGGFARPRPPGCGVAVAARAPPPPPQGAPPGPAHPAPHPARRPVLLLLLAAGAATAAPASARIETSRLLSGASAGPSGRSPVRATPPLRPPPPRPPTTPSVAAAVATIRAHTLTAQAAAARGDWGGAEAAYSAAIAAGPDLAISDLSRISRALVLRQLGDASGARLALEDVEVTLRGRAEVHAALAALRWEARLPGAEEQWALASEFDSRFSDPGWVEREKGWPPAMVGALRAFLELK